MTMTTVCTVPPHSIPTAVVAAAAAEIEQHFHLPITARRRLSTIPVATVTVTQYDTRPSESP